MNKIKSYHTFNEQSISQYFKSLITGEKTEDDKIARKILKDIDNIDFSYGGLYPHTLYFNYNGYRFSCMSGHCDLYGDDGKTEISSKFLRDVYEKGMTKAYAKRDNEYKLKKEKERKELEKETISFIENNGGFESLINNYIYQVFSYNKRISSSKLISKYDWLDNQGGVRYDLADSYIAIVAPNGQVDKNSITSIIYSFKTNELKISISYPAWSNHKSYKIIIKSDHDWYNILDDIRKDIIKYKSFNNEKSKTKSRILKNLFK